MEGRFIMLKYFEKRKEDAITDFYDYASPSDYLNTLKFLTSQYILSFDEDDLDQDHINEIMYSAGQIGEFIVKLKEECDRIEKLKAKGGNDE
jgi:hypothetical protein